MHRQGVSVMNIFRYMWVMWREGGGDRRKVPRTSPAEPTLPDSIDRNIQQSNELLNEARDRLSTYRDEVRYYKELSGAQKPPDRRRPE